jgi:hypothetical protein
MNDKNSSKIIKKITFSNNLTSTLKFVFFIKKKNHRTLLIILLIGTSSESPLISVEIEPIDIEQSK